MPRSTGRCTSDRRITVRVVGVKHRRSVHAHSDTRYKSHVSRSAAAALICVGYCWFRISALPPCHHQALSLCPSSYQQRASVIVASGDRDSRSPRAKGDSREVLPHLCAPPKARHRPFRPTSAVAATLKHHKCRSIAISGPTVASVAAVDLVAVPELPVVVIPPALDARVVLRSGASLNIHTEDGAGCLHGVSQGPASLP